MPKVNNAIKYLEEHAESIRDGGRVYSTGIVEDAEEEWALEIDALITELRSEEVDTD